MRFLPLLLLLTYTMRAAEHERRCPELDTPSGRLAIMDAGIRDEYLRVDDVTMTTHARFAPTCPSSGAPVRIATLAQAMGFDHFNWYQTIFEPSTEIYEISFAAYERYLAAFQRGATLTLHPHEFRPYRDSAAPAVLEPSPRNRPQVWVRRAPDGQAEAKLMYKGSDELPFYFNEGDEVAAYTSETTLEFEDAPYSPVGWYQLGGATQFKTRLVGVRADGGYEVFKYVGYDWQVAWEKEQSLSFYASF